MPEVTITVVDGNDRRPVTYAPVFVGGLQASTDARGIAKVNVPQNGTYKVVIKHSQYFPVNTQISVPPTAHRLEMMKATF